MCALYFLFMFWFVLCVEFVLDVLMFLPFVSSRDGVCVMDWGLLCLSVVCGVWVFLIFFVSFLLLLIFRGVYFLLVCCCILIVWVLCVFFLVMFCFSRVCLMWYCFVSLW